MKHGRFARRPASRRIRVIICGEHVRNLLCGGSLAESRRRFVCRAGLQPAADLQSAWRGQPKTVWLRLRCSVGQTSTSAPDLQVRLCGSAIWRARPTWMSAADLKVCPTKIVARENACSTRDSITHIAAPLPDRSALPSAPANNSRATRPPLTEVTQPPEPRDPTAAHRTAFP